MGQGCQAHDFLCKLFDDGIPKCMSGMAYAKKEVQPDDWKNLAILLHSSDTLYKEMMR